MSKDKLTDYDATAANNTDVGGISVDEGMLPSNVNNAIREVMSHLKDFAAGTEAVNAVAVDNLKLDGNTLSSTDTNGDINIDPDGTGNVAVTSGKLTFGSVNRYVQNPSGTELRLGADNSSGVITSHTNGSERMRIDSSGNVGIGTTSPDANLVVYESATSGTDHFAQRWRTQSGGVLSIACSDLSQANPTWQIRSGSSEPIAFNQASNERMRIDSSGNVLIANTTNNINNGGIMLRATGDTYYGITSTGNTLHVYDNTNSVYRFYVNGNGGIRNYSANNVNLSDQREKKNITDAASTWTDIKNFSIKEFHYNSEDDVDPKKIGVIAQDVQASNANLVSTFNVDEDTQRLAVKEQQITWMAIKALQEAIAKIENLEARVATLEGN